MTSRAAPGGTRANSRSPRDLPLTGEDLLRLFAGATAWLERNAPAIDAINVYPVPDGDTGSNMAGTLREALMSAPAGATAGEVARQIARGALLSARGNSGVILSQWLGGFAGAAGDAAHLDGATVAAALARASERAYAALREPAEGTILTVARAAAEAAQGTARRGPRHVFEAALGRARVALERTLQLLPVLREAGVVDAGGLGLVVLLEGAVATLRGEPIPSTPHAPRRPDVSWLASAGDDAGHTGLGYCTQLVISPAPSTPDALQRELERLGDSVIVAATADRARIHVHAADPGAVLSLCLTLGSLTRISVENMQAQFERFAAHGSAPAVGASPDHAGRVDEQQTAVITVLAGEGLAEVGRSLGASEIVAGGATANPSVDEILAAIRAAPAENVIVLPNHKNVVLAAEQAAALAEKQVVVLPTRSAAQGIAVLAAFQLRRPLAENLDAMRAALEAVCSIEVTRAARPTALRGMTVTRGQPIALIDGRIAAAAGSTAEALIAAVEQLQPQEGAALTVYYGGDVGQQEADAAVEQLTTRLPGLDVQLIAGGQPHYDFIAALE